MDITHSVTPAATVPTVFVSGDATGRKPEIPIDQAKVLHLINGEHFSGAERVQLLLAHGLPYYRYTADFVCLKDGKFVQQYNASHGSVATVSMHGRLDLRPVSQVARRVRREGHQLLHAHTPRTAMIASLVSRKTGLPWVYHVHSPAARDSSRRWLNRFNDWTERFSLRNCRHQITVSQSLRNELVAKGWSPDRVTTVHNGVPINPLPRSTPPTSAAPWTIGMVALLRPRKGLEVLLDALRCLLNVDLPVKLRCIGPFETQEYERSILAKVERLGLRAHVDFTGFTQDVPSYLRRLDAFVLPSLYGEGLPMVVLEAMAAGIPVVATRVEGTPEAIRHEEEGLLAEPNSAGSLAAQIERLVRGDVDWTRLSNAALKRHAASFSDDAMARGVAQVYDRCTSLQRQSHQ